MRLCYADPPYPGKAKRWYADEPEYAGEVDHVRLVSSLLQDFPDGWALSTSMEALRALLPLCPDDVRTYPWVKPMAALGGHRGFRPRTEYLLVVGGRRVPGTPDFLYAHPARGGGDLMGRKPLAYCAFLFDALGMEPGDELVDMFPGTGIVGRAWANLCGSSRDGAFRRPRTSLSSLLAGAAVSDDSSSNDSSPAADEVLDDVRRVPPPWGQLMDLIVGAQQRGYTQDQVDYLRAVVGVGWAKAFHAGQRDSSPRSW